MKLRLSFQTTLLFPKTPFQYQKGEKRPPKGAHKQVLYKGIALIGHRTRPILSNQKCRSKAQYEIEYLSFNGKIISSSSSSSVLVAKYDGYLKDATMHGGEPHYGREVTWSTKVS